MTVRAVDLVVKGGRVVTASDVVEAGVAIHGGRIVALAPDEWLPPADRVIDATGKLVFPGLIDCHLHVGPEYDDWKVAAEAAARTGLTSVVPFVNYTAGETLPQLESVPRVVQLGRVDEATRWALVRGALARLRIAARDPWGRRAAVLLAFRSP